VSRRWLIAVIAGAVVAVIVWVMARDRGDPGRTGQPATGNRQPAMGSRNSGDGSDVGRQRPVLPGGDSFEGEPRVAGWADAHEREIRARVAKLGVDVDQVECRTRRCQLVVSGEGAGFDDGLAAMQDDRGFYGWAREMMVGNLRTDGARRSATVTLVFD
jgi:hypothetical protein